MGCGTSPRSRAPGVRSTGPWKPSNAAPASTWASDRSKTSPAGLPSTSTPSTSNDRHPAARSATSRCSRVTAKASSCAPVRYAQQPRRPPRTRTPDSQPACPRARNEAGNEWPRSVRSTTSHPSLVARPTSCPATTGRRRDTTPGPSARNKWLIASVVNDAATVVTAIFDEADRRDPHHLRTRIALVDGNVHQIQRIQAEANDRGITVVIIIDFVHVLEYIWKAAWTFHHEGDPAAETWVRKHAQTILDGHPTRVAGALRRAATIAGLDTRHRENADKCATYLTNKQTFLDYPTALKQGWPIATGIIEGACRHLVKDRMDLTGARWGLHGAEAILKLRALHSNGDFDAYWRYHLNEEQQRVHLSRYADNLAPQAA